MIGILIFYSYLIIIAFIEEKVLQVVQEKTIEEPCVPDARKYLIQKSY